MSPIDVPDRPASIDGGGTIDNAATVDDASCVVEVDGSQWPFEIDLATGVVTVDIGGQAHTVQPLSWREKVTLARYARARTSLLDAALLRHRLGARTDTDARIGSAAPAPSLETRALVALARWLNDFGPGGSGAPLDPVTLTGIASRASRASGLSLPELDALTAAEVELIAAAAHASEASEARAVAAFAAQQAGSPSIDDHPTDDGLTRIVVVPDPAPSHGAQADQEAREQAAAEAPAPEQGVPEQPAGAHPQRPPAA
ncbi:MAG: hypothetical protein M3O94_00040, partial [Actinomycetota bacterium]|nr:hypothetical protein [Actinomycetota bacterium]